MPAELEVPGGQLLRLQASGVHVSPWTAYQPYVAEGAAFQRLKDSIMFMSGNVQPVGVRRTGRWPDGYCGTYELIFGHLRLQACQELGIPVLAVFEEIGDRELLVHFTAEHLDKIEAFPWRFGTACFRALQEGLYPSTRKLYEALDVPLAELALAMKLSQLPLQVRQLFHRIDMSWAVSRRLVDRFERDPAGTLMAAERAERLFAVSALHAFRKAFPDGLLG
jgi:ParB family transcriptional regulator, chromosome partitioning protein